MIEVLFPNEEEWKILEQFLDGDGVIIVPPEDAKRLKKRLGYKEDDEMELEVDYDFGGSPDKYVDIARYWDSEATTYAMDAIIEAIEGEEEDE